MQLSYIYILTNDRKTVLYIGVTSDLAKRLSEHKSGGGSSFTKKYNVDNLINYEEFTDINKVIEGEKQLKKLE